MPLSVQWEKNYLNLELVMIIITTVNMYLFITYNWRYMLWPISIILGLNFVPFFPIRRTLTTLITIPKSTGKQNFFQG